MEHSKEICEHMPALDYRKKKADAWKILTVSITIIRDLSFRLSSIIMFKLLGDAEWESIRR